MIEIAYSFNKSANVFLIFTKPTYLEIVCVRLQKTQLLRPRNFFYSGLRYNYPAIKSFTEEVVAEPVAMQQTNSLLIHRSKFGVERCFRHVQFLSKIQNFKRSS